MTTATLSDAQVLTGTWAVDPVLSRVGFAVKQMAIANTRGEFREFEGMIEIGEDLESSRAYGTVRAASVYTNQGQRDEHLRSADFFDVANHAELRFESKRIEAIDDGTFRIIGELEMHGVTHELELEAEVIGSGEGMSGEERLGLEVRGTLDRRDYGMSLNAALNAVIAEKVKLELDIAAVKQD